MSIDPPAPPPGMDPGRAAEAFKEQMDRNLRQQAAMEETLQKELRRSEVLGDHYEVQKKLLDIELTRQDTVLRQLSSLEKSGAAMDDLNTMLANNENLFRAINIEAEELGMTYDDYVDSLNDADNAWGEVHKAAQKYRGIMDDARGTMGKLENLAQGFANKMGMATKTSDTTSGKIFEMGMGLKDAMKAGKNFGATIGAMGKQMANPLMILFMIVDKVAKIIGTFVLETDTIAKNFTKTTGITGQFRDNIQDVSKNLVKAGVSSQDVGTGFAALAANYSMFDKNADAVNNNLLTNITLLDKMGVSAAESAKNMDFLTRSMGMNATQANDVNLQIATMGDNMGVSASKMMSDFKSVSGTISVYGDRMVGVFQNLAATARATGLEMSELVAIGQKFDTFSDAATNAGKLNAVLGTNISAMEMMNMNEAERVQLLREQIKMSVGDMGNLDRYTQKFIAQSLGMKDVAAARALINMEESEMLANQAKQEAAAKTQEEMLKIQEEMQPVMERLSLAFKSAVLQMAPLIEATTWMLDAFVDFVEFVDAAVTGDGPLGKLLTIIWLIIKPALILVGVVTALTLAIFYLPVAIINWVLSTKYAMAALDWVISVVEKFQGFLFGLFGILGGLGTVISWLATAAIAGITGVTAPLWLLVAGITAIVVGIWELFAVFTSITGPMELFGDGLGDIWGWITMSGSPFFYEMFGVIAGHAETLGNVLSGTLTSAVDTIVGGLKSLWEIIKPVFEKFAEAPSALLGMANGFIALGTAAGGAAFGLFASVGGLAAILGTMAMGGMDFADMLNVGDNVVKMATAMDKFGSGLSKIKAISAELAAIQGDGFLAVTSDGSATSVVMGSGDVMQNFVDGKLTVDVKMPDFNMPEIILNVTVNGSDVSVEKIIANA